MKTKTYLFLSCVVLGILSCSPPRSIINSGKVATKNQVRFGNNYSLNISSSPITQSAKGIHNLADNFSGKDSIQFTDQVSHINSAVLAYCLDPIGTNTDLYLRYGLGHRMDIGYRTSGSSHAVDMMYQFLGSNENYKNSDKGGMYGSIGLQYGWEKYSFSNKFNRVQKLLDMNMSRRDVSVPLIFSKSFGPEERSGCFSFGLVYSHSFVTYNIKAKNIYIQNNNDVKELVAPVNAKMDYGSYGTFINMKVGRRFIFFNASLAAYYQNYGNYPLLGGGMASLEGISIIPSYGVQFNILPRKRKIPKEL